MDGRLAASGHFLVPYQAGWVGHTGLSPTKSETLTTPSLLFNEIPLGQVEGSGFLGKGEAISVCSGKRFLEKITGHPRLAGSLGITQTH